MTGYRKLIGDQSITNWTDYMCILRVATYGFTVRLTNHYCACTVTSVATRLMYIGCNIIMTTIIVSGNIIWHCVIINRIKH